MDEVQHSAFPLEVLVAQWETGLHMPVAPQLGCTLPPPRSLKTIPTLDARFLSARRMTRGVPLECEHRGSIAGWDSHAEAPSVLRHEQLGMEVAVRDS